MSGHRIPFDLYNAQNKALLDPGTAGTIKVDRDLAHCALVSTGTETRTLAAPGQANLRVAVYMKTDGGDITLTVTGGYSQAGDTTIVFNDTGDFVKFLSVEQGAGTYVWRIIGYDGVTGPTIAVGSLLAAGSVKSNSATAGIGYATGAGGTVTQATSKSTGVTLSKVVGQITMNNAALAAGAEATFTVTNTAVAATDVVVACHGSAGTSGAYLVGASNITAGTFDITVSNVSAGSLSEAIVINFAVIKGVSA